MTVTHLKSCFRVSHCLVVAERHGRCSLHCSVGDAFAMPECWSIRLECLSAIPSRHDASLVASMTTALRNAEQWLAFTFDMLRRSLVPVQTMGIIHLPIPTSYNSTREAELWLCCKRVFASTRAGGQYRCPYHRLQRTATKTSTTKLHFRRGDVGIEKAAMGHDMVSSRSMGLLEDLKKESHAAWSEEMQNGTELACSLGLTSYELRASACRVLGSRCSNRVHSVLIILFARRIWVQARCHVHEQITIRSRRTRQMRKQ